MAQGRSGDGARFCYSQDGIRWMDLEALPQAVAEKAATINTQLSGEPSKTYPVSQPGAPMPAADAVGAGLGKGANSSVWLCVRTSLYQRGLHPYMQGIVRQSYTAKSAGLTGHALIQWEQKVGARARGFCRLQAWTALLPSGREAHRSCTCTAAPWLRSTRLPRLYSRHKAALAQHLGR